MTEGKSALGFVELHRGDAEIEDNAVDRARSRRPRATASQIGEPSSTSTSRPPDACTRSAPSAIALLVAVDADDAAIRRGEDGAAVAAGAEGGVDVDAAVTRH